MVLRRCNCNIEVVISGRRAAGGGRRAAGGGRWAVGDGRRAAGGGRRPMTSTHRRQPRRTPPCPAVRPWSRARRRWRSPSWSSSRCWRTRSSARPCCTQHVMIGTTAPGIDSSVRQRCNVIHSVAYNVCPRVIERSLCGGGIVAWDVHAISQGRCGAAHKMNIRLSIKNKLDYIDYQLNFAWYELRRLTILRRCCDVETGRT